jgi:hypothetical protein
LCRYYFDRCTLLALGVCGSGRLERFPKFAKNGLEASLTISSQNKHTVPARRDTSAEPGGSVFGCFVALLSVIVVVLLLILAIFKWVKGSHGERINTANAFLSSSRFINHSGRISLAQFKAIYFNSMSKLQQLL